MKKIKLTDKLSLNKETVSRLNEGQMQNVKGGFTFGLSLGAVCRWSNNKNFDKDACKARYTKSPWCNNTPSGSIDPVATGLPEDPGFV